MTGLRIPRSTRCLDKPPGKQEVDNKKGGVSSRQAADGTATGHDRHSKEVPL